MGSEDSHVKELLAQYGWIWNHLDEVEADFLRFYGIDEPVDLLPGSKFFKLAKALPAYNGAVTAAGLRQQEEAATAPQTPSSSTSRQKESTSSQYNFERLRALKQGGKNIQNVEATKSTVDADTKEAFRERMRKAERE